MSGQKDMCRHYGPLAGTGHWQWTLVCMLSTGHRTCCEQSKEREREVFATSLVGERILRKTVVGMERNALDIYRCDEWIRSYATSWDHTTL